MAKNVPIMMGRIKSFNACFVLKIRIEQIARKKTITIILLKERKGIANNPAIEQRQAAPYLRIIKVLLSGFFSSGAMRIRIYPKIKLENARIIERK